MSVQGAFHSGIDRLYIPSSSSISSTVLPGDGGRAICAPGAAALDLTGEPLGPGRTQGEAPAPGAFDGDAPGCDAAMDDAAAIMDGLSLPTRAGRAAPPEALPLTTMRKLLRRTGAPA